MDCDVDTAGPMLAAPVSDRALLPGWAGEPKLWRGLAVARLRDATVGRSLIRQRHGMHSGTPGSHG